MITSDNLRNVKEVLNNSKSVLDLNRYNEKLIFESLGYKFHSRRHPFEFIPPYYFHMTTNKNYIKIYKCSENYSLLKISDFDLIKDFKTYKTFLKCQDKNKQIIKEIDEITKNIEDNPSTYEHINEQFQKCYQNFNIEKVRNRCVIYETDNKSLISDKIKNYINKESKNLDKELINKIENKYKIKKEVDCFGNACVFKYMIDEDL